MSKPIILLIIFDIIIFVPLLALLIIIIPMLLPGIILVVLVKPVLLLLTVLESLIPSVFGKEMEKDLKKFTRKSIRTR